MTNCVHIKGYTEKEGNYYCEDCNNWFDELKIEHEYRGEFWGTPSYEDMYYCPICGSEKIIDKDNIILDHEEDD